MASAASISQQLAAFASEFPSERIPREVIDRVRSHMADGIGLAIAGSRTAFAGSILRGLDEEGAGACTVLGNGARLSAANAALANGVAIHSDDFDDTMFEATMHPTGVVVGAGLAVAEAVDAAASDLLPALVVGYEVLIRLGLVAPGALLRRGFHATSVCGVFASSAVAARLMKLTREQTAHALGIAGSMSSGVLEYLGDGSSMKRFHPGWAARGGIQAAQFARAGADGPRHIFEGRYSLYNTFLAGEEVALHRATDDLGSEWQAMAVAMKFYPMCHFLHAFADCALQLRREHGLNAADIERATCFIAKDQVSVVCEPAVAKVTPRTPYEAKFSLSWCVAAAVIDGTIDLATFDEQAIGRSDVSALASRVGYEVDPRSLYPASFSARLVLQLKDGRTVSTSCDGPVGSTASPATADMLWNKFRANVDIVRAGIDAHELQKRIQAFDGIASTRELTACATASQARP